MPEPRRPQPRPGRSGSDQAATRSARGPLATARLRLDEVGAGLVRIEAAARVGAIGRGVGWNRLIVGL